GHGRRAQGAPRPRPRSVARGDQGRRVGQRLPLRHLPADLRGRTARREVARRGRCQLSEQKVGLGFEGGRVEKTFDVEKGEPAPWGLGSKLDVVEKRWPRVDGVLKATGRAVYTHDVRVPGMLVGAILRSPFAAAKIKSCDLSAAKALAGVAAVVRADRGGK